MNAKQDRRFQGCKQPLLALVGCVVCVIAAGCATRYTVVEHDLATGVVSNEWILESVTRDGLLNQQKRALKEGTRCGFEECYKIGLVFIELYPEDKCAPEAVRRAAWAVLFLYDIPQGPSLTPHEQADLNMEVLKTAIAMFEKVRNLAATQEMRLEAEGMLQLLRNGFLDADAFHLFVDAVRATKVQRPKISDGIASTGPLLKQLMENHSQWCITYDVPNLIRSAAED